MKCRGQNQNYFQSIHQLLFSSACRMILQHLFHEALLLPYIFNKAHIFGFRKVVLPPCVHKRAVEVQKDLRHVPESKSVSFAKMWEAPQSSEFCLSALRSGKQAIHTLESHAVSPSTFPLPPRCVVPWGASGGQCAPCCSSSCAGLTARGR